MSSRHMRFSLTLGRPEKSSFKTYVNVRWKLRGYRKIEYTCQQARLDELTYAWVDTCCIDKNSSAELSESINSMYGFYERAQVCFVYLSNVRGHGLLIADPNEDVLRVISPDEPEPDTAHRALLESFANSRWFTRRWCLQELIAPYHLRFYDEQWES
nr:vegetative incompatibility protein het-e-1 [Quercus suber]